MSRLNGEKPNPKAAAVLFRYRPRVGLTGSAWYRELSQVTGAECGWPRTAAIPIGVPVPWVPEKSGDTRA